ncbi:MAG: polynucleotide adenylyltransferase PcnB [Candidatus Competibacterales bacterium]
MTQYDSLKDLDDSSLPPNPLADPEADATSSRPLIYARGDHGISRSEISPNALKVLYRLRTAGYQACLVGGGVRDLLLGVPPKDFDIATDARPEEVYQLFRNCRLIGRRFRLAHVHFNDEIIEVATFRAAHTHDLEDDEAPKNGLIVNDDNVYGDIDQDALRRDFTVNALYYDIEDFSVRDYAGGMADLRGEMLRLIGDPEVRYREDPVRMLRAVRFAAKLGFRLHPDTEAPIQHLGHLLRAVPPARLFDEVLKLFLAGHAVAALEQLRLYGLFGHLFPLTERCLQRPGDQKPRRLLKCALANTDARVKAGKPVTPAFLYAALLWEPYRERQQRLVLKDQPEHEAGQGAAEAIIQEQIRATALPRRFSQPMREIWSLQPRFAMQSGKRPQRLMGHPRFRAALDFLLLRAEAGESEDLAELVDWWQRQDLPPPVDDNLEEPAPRRGRRRRRRGENAEANAAAIAGPWE